MSDDARSRTGPRPGPQIPPGKTDNDRQRRKKAESAGDRVRVMPLDQEGEVIRLAVAGRRDAGRAEDQTAIGRWSAWVERATSRPRGRS